MNISKRMVLSCLAAVLTLSLVGAASAQNILENGDFETGDLTGWQINGGNASAFVAVQSPDNGPTLPGTYNAYMENYGEALGLNMKQTTPPGTGAAGEVTYSYDLKLIEAAIGGVMFVEIFCEQEGVGIIGGSGLMGPLWPWNEWTTYSGSFIAPANTDFITIQFVATTGAAVGSSCVIHVDNVIVETQAPVATEQTSMGNVKALYR